MGVFGRMKRAWMLRKMKKQYHLTQEGAQRVMQHAESYRMDPFTFLEQELHTLKDEMLKELFVDDSQLRMYVEIVSEQFGRSMACVYQAMKHAKEEYKIPYRYFAEEWLMKDYSEQTLAEARQKRLEKRKRHIDRLVEVTGWDAEKAKSEFTRIRRAYGFGRKGYLARELYKKTDEEIAELQKERDDQKAALHQRIHEKTGWDEYEIYKHIEKCKIVFGVERPDYENTRCYELSDAQLYTYANTEDAKRLSEIYNTEDVRVLIDKPLFDESYQPFLGRKYWVNRDTSFTEFQEFVQGLDEIFLKPVALQKASGTRKVKVRQDLQSLQALYEELTAEPKLLVEEVVKQHPAMAEFYADSVNTVRIFSILKDERFHVFAAFVRFGVTGVADNLAAGGVGCGVDEKTGLIITPAMDGNGNILEYHPVSHKKFVGFQIPNWDQILSITQAALRHREGINFVGWDVAVTLDGAVIIEGNSIPSLSTYQEFFVYNQEGKKHTYEEFLS